MVDKLVVIRISNYPTSLIPVRPEQAQQRSPRKSLGQWQQMILDRCSYRTMLEKNSSRIQFTSTATYTGLCNTFGDIENGYLTKPILVLFLYTRNPEKPYEEFKLDVVDDIRRRKELRYIIRQDVNPYDIDTRPQPQLSPEGVYYLVTDAYVEFCYDCLIESKKLIFGEHNWDEIYSNPIDIYSSRTRVKNPNMPTLFERAANAHIPIMVYDPQLNTFLIQSCYLSDRFFFDYSFDLIRKSERKGFIREKKKKIESLSECGVFRDRQKESTAPVILISDDMTDGIVARKDKNSSLIRGEFDRHTRELVVGETIIITIWWIKPPTAHDYSLINLDQSRSSCLLFIVAKKRPVGYILKQYALFCHDNFTEVNRSRVQESVINTIIEILSISLQQTAIQNVSQKLPLFKQTETLWLPFCSYILNTIYTRGYIYTEEQSLSTVYENGVIVLGLDFFFNDLLILKESNRCIVFILRLEDSQDERQAIVQMIMKEYDNARERYKPLGINEPNSSFDLDFKSSSIFTEVDDGRVANTISKACMDPILYEEGMIPKTKSCALSKSVDGAFFFASDAITKQSVIYLIHNHEIQRNLKSSIPFRVDENVDVMEFGRAMAYSFCTGYIRIIEIDGKIYLGKTFGVIGFTDFVASKYTWIQIDDNIRRLLPTTINEPAPSLPPLPVEEEIVAKRRPKRALVQEEEVVAEQLPPPPPVPIKPAAETKKITKAPVAKKTTKVPVEEIEQPVAFGVPSKEAAVQQPIPEPVFAPPPTKPKAEEPVVFGGQQLPPPPTEPIVFKAVVPEYERPRVVSKRVRIAETPEETERTRRSRRLAPEQPQPTPVAVSPFTVPIAEKKPVAAEPVFSTEQRIPVGKAVTFEATPTTPTVVPPPKKPTVISIVPQPAPTPPSFQAVPSGELPEMGSTAAIKRRALVAKRPQESAMSEEDIDAFVEVIDDELFARRPGEDDEKYPHYKAEWRVIVNGYKKLQSRARRGDNLNQLKNELEQLISAADALKTRYLEEKFPIVNK